jgi:uncharacterized membrane protein YoaK (UPF0700 family)
MKFIIILLFIVAASQAVSFFNLVVEEWETFKVSRFFGAIINSWRKIHGHLQATVIITSCRGIRSVPLFM